MSLQRGKSLWTEGAAQAPQGPAMGMHGGRAHSGKRKRRPGSLGLMDEGKAGLEMS